MILGQQTFSLKATGDAPEVISANWSPGYPIRLRGLKHWGDGNSILFLYNKSPVLLSETVCPPGVLGLHLSLPIELCLACCLFSITMVYCVLNPPHQVLQFLCPAFPPHQSHLDCLPPTLWSALSPTLAPGIFFCNSSERNNSWIRSEVKHYKLNLNYYLALHFMRKK